MENFGRRKLEEGIFIGEKNEEYGQRHEVYAYTNGLGRVGGQRMEGIKIWGVW